MKKVAIIGYGYWGKNLVRNFNQLGVLHTICDIDQDKLRQAKEDYPNVSTTSDYSKAIINSEIDGIVIATSSSTHYAITRLALLSDKDVFVEKPFTLDVLEAIELVELANLHKRIILVGYLLIYHPAIQLLKKIIDSGELGDIHYLYTIRVNLGQVRNDEDVWWRVAPHDIAIISYLLNETPKVISAQGFSYLQPGLIDVAFATMIAGKVTAHMQVSWLDPHKIRQLTIVGSKKMVVFDDMETQDKLKIYDKGIISGSLSTREGGVYSPKVENVEPLTIECSEFIKCMENRIQPLTNASQGLAVTKVLETASRLMYKERNK